MSTFTLVFIDAYILRMRHLIEEMYYPEKKKARAAWLYSHIMKTRMGILTDLYNAIYHRVRGIETAGFFETLIARYSVNVLFFVFFNLTAGIQYNNIFVCYINVFCHFYKCNNFISNANVKRFYFVFRCPCVEHFLDFMGLGNIYCIACAKSGSQKQIGKDFIKCQNYGCKGMIFSIW